MGLSRINRAQTDGVTHSRKLLNRLGWQGVYLIHGITQYLRQRTPVVEVKGMLGIQSYLGVTVLNCAVEGLSIWSNGSSHSLNPFVNTWVVTAVPKL